MRALVIQTLPEAQPGTSYFHNLDELAAGIPAFADGYFDEDFFDDAFINQEILGGLLDNEDSGDDLMGEEAAHEAPQDEPMDEDQNQRGVKRSSGSDDENITPQPFKKPSKKKF